MPRIEAIRRIKAAHPGAFFLFSNGLTAREAAHFADGPENFYLLHAMGEALSVGIGLALARPELTVVVVDGDGNALMGLAAWSMMPVANLRYYVLANGVYETTGGQPLPKLPWRPPWCTVVPVAPDPRPTPNPPAPKATWARAKAWLGEHGNP
ncbi:MAG: thiamine pyrophosphate-dependent enzyme [Solidesulfovibrio sp.]|uniref:thiamine pyrophosphate-dependent enzyme n=1 Tax=Solidesulfovibrio sp. TaxID=2910990 RepID=UPI0031581ADA